MSDLIYHDEAAQLAGVDLAAEMGVREAARQLNVGKSTVQRWTDKHRARWRQKRAELEAQRADNAAARLEDLAEEYIEVEHMAVKQARRKIPEADAKETAALVKALGSSRGLAVQNARAVGGAADKTVDVNINFGQLEAAIEALLNGAPAPAALADVEGTAEDA